MRNFIEVRIATTISHVYSNFIFLRRKEDFIRITELYTKGG